MLPKDGIALGRLPMVINYQCFKQVSSKSDFEYCFSIEFKSQLEYDAYNSSNGVRGVGRKQKQRSNRHSCWGGGSSFRLDNGLFHCRSGVLEDGFGEHIETSRAFMYPIWIESRIFEPGFSSGFY